MYRRSSLRSVASASWVTLLAPLALLACSGSSASGTGSSAETTTGPGGIEVMSSLKIVPTPAGGLAIYSPIIKGIKPGDDVTYCSYTDVTAPEDLFIHFTQGAQTRFGHHAILYYETSPQPVGTDLCTGQSMETLTQLIGGTGGEGIVDFSGIPANAGTIIPKGAQFVIQSHWINTGEEVADGQAMLVTEPGPATDRVVLGTLAIANLGFNVPPVSPGESSLECTLDADQKIILTLGHEHEWGTHVRADLTLAATGADKVLFDRPFTPHDVFAPPLDMYSLDQPLLMSKGDKLKIDCQWQNTTQEALTFPREMCVFFSYSLTPGDLRCVQGAWMRTGAALSGADGGAPVDGGAPAGN
jgi:hypothetical protein